ncbi:hypothetical protein JKA74_09645 [Marivirga sp. S37H4]|uniref:Grasp-with-spasm system ATP-grasp peptide maturase n=1 Tax=Marivirga aurantiaca TaxID=2802615 RepID=A0A935CBC9_9BACT|nr:hypothetical protein [Marivirga aurantiaca]MBK6265303.1 hypothetical protein [Marivirga aurantiaca]
MILILGYENFEQGTDPVIDWLLFHKANFIKVTLDSLFFREESFHIDVNNSKIYYKGIDLGKEVNVVWYRRFKDDRKIGYKEAKHADLKDSLSLNLQAELSTIFDYICHILKDKLWLPPPERFYTNKLLNLNLAQQAGFRVPATSVTNSKQVIKETVNFRKKSSITKPISEGARRLLQAGNLTFIQFAKTIEANILDELPDFFFPSLIQDKLKIDYEIRVFFLAGKLFATKIESSEEESSDDRRTQDESKLVHSPYTLPESVAEMVNEFMRLANLNSGCIDLAKCERDEFFFLEVNPVGQYLFESKKCNYYIEREIANWLVQNDRSSQMKIA